MPVSVSYVPTLEDLRQHEAAAWLWDGARSRVVWANQAGIAAFSCISLFDLVDRTFAAEEPGVARILELSKNLPRGTSELAMLHFPSAGLVTPLMCQTYIHALADGRAGVLAVAETQIRQAQSGVEQPVETIKKTKTSPDVFASLPIAMVVCRSDGTIRHWNDAAGKLFDGITLSNLHRILGNAAAADALLQQLATSGAATSVAKTLTRDGERELRLVMTRATDAVDADILVVIENTSGQHPFVNESGPPPSTSSDKAFEVLTQSMKARLREQASLTASPDHTTADVSVEQKADRAITPIVAAKLIEKPLIVTTEKPAPQSTATPKHPAVPNVIRNILENASDALLISRSGAALYANRRALACLEAANLSEVLDDADLWSALDAAKPIDGLQISRSTFPWHNGPAEKFVISGKRISQPNIMAPETSAIAEIPAYPSNPATDTELSVGDANKIATQPLRELVPMSVPVAAQVSAPEQVAVDRRVPIASDELQAILDVASDGIITLDANGSILSFSAGAEAIFGRNFEDVREKPLADLLQTESRKLVRDYLAGLNGHGLASVFNDGREVLATNGQGAVVPLFLTVGKLQSPHSRASFCAVVRDITPWKRTEQDLREAKEKAELANRQKSDFLARISHELRTPLNAILGFSEVMRLERFGPLKNDKYKAYANDIHTSGTHLLSLINDLLDLSKVEAGKLELNFTAVSLEDVAEHALRLLQSDAATAGVLLRKSLPANMPRVVADNRSMQQIMLNLLSNGMKYTNAGGQVIVSAVVDQAGNLVLRIKDTGIGMTDSQLVDALEPFTRVETSERVRQGTGLGLPLTKSLVEANRARFVMSSVPGKGTLAEIIFPGTRVLAE